MSSLMIVSAALTNSVAKFPCVTTTPPISGICPLEEEGETRGQGDKEKIGKYSLFPLLPVSLSPPPLVPLSPAHFFTSLCVTRARCSLRLRCFPISFATATERCRPPVHPIATVT